MKESDWREEYKHRIESSLFVLTHSKGTLDVAACVAGTLTESDIDLATLSKLSEEFFEATQ